MKNFKPWILAARPKTLFAGMSPVIIGLSVSYHLLNSIDIIVATLTLVIAIFLQIGSNLANDAYDFLKGSDNSINRKGPKRMAESGALEVKAIINVMYLIFILCVLMGTYLVIKGGWPIIIIGLASIFFAILYTAGPFALAYNGLGDFFVFLFFGLISTIGTIFLQTKSLNGMELFFNNQFLIVLSSIAIGTLNTAILVVNNLRDYESDKLSRKNTIVVFLGKRFACYEYAFLLLINFICIVIIALITRNYFFIPFLFIGIFLSCNLTISIFNYDNINLNRLLEKTAKYTFFNAMFFAVSFYLDSL